MHTCTYNILCMYMCCSTTHVRTCVVCTWVFPRWSGRRSVWPPSLLKQERTRLHTDRLKLSCILNIALSPHLNSNYSLRFVREIKNSPKIVDANDDRLRSCVYGLEIIYNSLFYLPNQKDCYDTISASIHQFQLDLTYKKPQSRNSKMRMKT